MLTETELRYQVRAALEAVSPPAPWLTAVIREEVRRGRASRLDRSRRERTRFALASSVIILVAAALAAAILINQLSTPIQVHNPPPHQGSATVLLGQTQFITPQDALVVTKQGLLITRDGGEHWQLRLKRDNGNSLTVRVIDSNHILALSGSQLHSLERFRGLAPGEQLAGFPAGSKVGRDLSHRRLWRALD